MVLAIFGKPHLWQTCFSVSSVFQVDTPLSSFVELRKRHLVWAQKYDKTIEARLCVSH